MIRDMCGFEEIEYKDVGGEEIERKVILTFISMYT
jgi:hypothetical protein